MVDKTSLKAILILSEGINGHVNQSKGVAYWLSTMTDAATIVAEVPKLSLRDKLYSRYFAKCVAEGTKTAEDFMCRFNLGNFTEKILDALSEYGAEEGGKSLLVLSTGSTAAPFNIYLSELFDSLRATIMTPTYLRTSPFDFAIVPEHDAPDNDKNIFMTLGSPNNIIKETLHLEAVKLLKEVPPKNDVIWSVMVGGDDSNYRISRKWINEHVGKILQSAEENCADVYITTSRRTSDEAESALKKLQEQYDCMRYLLIANEVNFNPIPAMLDFSSAVFCTDDSVNMVSESVTGGQRVILMRAERKRSIKYILQLITQDLVERDYISASHLWGIPRFDGVFERFSEKDCIIEFNQWHPDETNSEKVENKIDFNEAYRAAQWIFNHYKKSEVLK